MAVSMNRYERPLPAGTEAKILYGTPEYKVMKHGSFVRCAVTGLPILIDDLKYWSVDLQEAYSSAETMWQRHRSLQR
jgi:hypothetical protein